MVNGVDYLFEQLPTYERDLRFRYIIRDNAPENGATVWRDLSIDVYDNSSSGTFKITNYNVKDTIQSGGYALLTWDVAATDQPPLNDDYLDIYLSTDGGVTFPHLLKSHTLNDGETYVNIPNIPAIRFRFMLAVSDNIYYDVNDRSGVIRPRFEEAIGVSYDDQYYTTCAPDIIDFDISSFGMGGFDSDVHFDVIGNLPTGGKASFLNPTIPAGNATTLRLDFRDVTESGEFDISFSVSGEGVDTIIRSIEMNVVTNDFSELSLDFPLDGSTGNAFVPTLQWNPVPSAVNYTVELSSDANFETILFTRNNLMVDEINLDIQLEAGGIYFWRIKPKNDCGLQDINRVSSFQVKSLACEEFCSTEPSITLSSSGTPQAEMSINTGSAITVNDLNVTQILGRHSDMGQVVLTLEGPDGTQVEMMSEGTCGYVNTPFDMGFDDDAAIVNPNCINFNQGIRFVPDNPLSAMNDVTGTTYKLIMQDVASGSGGRLDSWCFEICGPISPENPLLVRADSIHLLNLESKVISSDKLEVTHSLFTANELELTIVETPNYGTMLFDGVPVGAGTQMTMQDIENNRLTYQNESMFYDRDHFSFIVTDPGGGFLGTPMIEFVVGLTATQQALPEGNELIIYPNPAIDNIEIKLLSDDIEVDEIVIFNIQGAQMSHIKNNLSNETSIDLSNYASGIYLIQVRSGQYTTVRKFIKQ